MKRELMFWTGCYLGVAMGFCLGILVTVLA
jgi:hypothetical protein